VGLAALVYYQAVAAAGPVGMVEQAGPVGFIRERQRLLDKGTERAVAAVMDQVMHQPQQAAPVALVSAS
jgi:hypothetical protein